MRIPLRPAYTAAMAPLLRSPPFPWGDAAVSFADVGVFAGNVAAGAFDDQEAIFAAMRMARVGGAFWAAPAKGTPPAAIILRPGAAVDVAGMETALLPTDRQRALWVAADARLQRRLAGIITRGGGTLAGDVDPWSALNGAQRIVAHGDDEWVALAAIAGVEVQVLSPGIHGVPGDDAAALRNRAGRALSALRWRDPFTGEASDIMAAIDLLGMWRRTFDANLPIAAASGMAWWKRAEIRRFLWHPARKTRIVRRPSRALKIAQRSGGSVAIWPSRVSPSLLSQAAEANAPLVRVEDGFVRSVGLGVDLVPPSSVVVDVSGIHFDPRSPSDLETVLNGIEKGSRLIDRARKLRQEIVAAGISKYSADTVASTPKRMPDRKLVLVPGQVEDDMSVLAGGGGLQSNLELLRRTRALEPDAEIWFRPHPDVDAGHRKGRIDDADALGVADRIVRGGGMAPLLDIVDAVHVLTSLTGFEALLRGRAVTCHGTPFYAGWGLTTDLGAVPQRRQRRLTLDELVAGVLILYPRYLDPVTGVPCPPEVLVSRMASASAANRLSWIAPLRRIQGRIMTLLR